MNLENKPGEQREVPERFPSREEIVSVCETILGHKNYTELRLRSDEGGVRFYEIEVALENGEKKQYYYEKATYDYKGVSLPTSAKFSASMHVVRYDSEGMPYEGQCVANYFDGTWQYVPETA